jgi:hypothetical protein
MQITLLHKIQPSITKLSSPFLYRSIFDSTLLDLLYFLLVRALPRTIETGARFPQTDKEGEQTQNSGC